jgi:hypothetical protein
MADMLSIHVWIWNTETCQSHFKKQEEEERESRRRRTKPGTLHTYMEMPHWNALYNYYVLMKVFFKDWGQDWEAWVADNNVHGRVLPWKFAQMHSGLFMSEKRNFCCEIWGLFVTVAKHGPSWLMHCLSLRSLPWWLCVTSIYRALTHFLCAKPYSMCWDGKVNQTFFLTSSCS